MIQQINSNEELFRHIDSLIGAWCDRRCLSALRSILATWPMASPLTDSWAGLLVAMQNVRAFARTETTEDEKQILESCILAVDSMLRAR